MIILPTASHTDTFLNCPAPWGMEITPEQRPPEVEGAKYGTLFHAIQAERDMSKHRAIAAQADDPAELLARARAARKALYNFTHGQNAWGINFYAERVPVAREQAFMLRLRGKSKFDLAGGCAVTAGPSQELHEYPEQILGSICGTADYILVNSAQKLLFVGDWKTGWINTYDIFNHGQLRTLGLMALRALVGKDVIDWRVFLAIMEAQKDKPPRVVAEEVPVELLLREHLHNLQSAQDRVGHGFYRPGDVQCRWCPARAVCPIMLGKDAAETRAMVLAAGGLLKKVKKSSEGVTADNGGRLHQLSNMIDRLQERVRKDLLDLVRTGELIMRPDGKILVLEKRVVERLSKGSVVRGIGAERAEKLFDELRHMGCMEIAEQEELHARENE
jgi:hypothetical protein